MEPNGKPSLKDVDGTEPGKVQLMSIKLVDGSDSEAGQMRSYSEEGDAEVDPWTLAEGLKRSVEGDWPEHYWAIVGNWRAHYLKWARTMKTMGVDFGEDALSPQEYLDTFK